MEVFRLKNRLSYLQLVILSLVSVAYGCGGGGYVTPTGSGGNGGGGDNTGGGGTGGNSVVSMQGAWEFQFQSAVSPANFFVVEANLSQAGTHVFSGAPSTLVYQSKGPLVTTLTLSRFGGQCDNGGGTDQVTFDGMLSNQQPTTETITFTLTENGSLGSSVLTGTASTNGSSIGSTGGSYTLPASCGFPEDHGTFYGYQDSLAVSGSNYTGTFNSGADAITMNFVPVTAGFGITATGTDNGTPFTLTGSTVGLSLTLTGTVSGHAVTWFGIYDSTYNTFNFYTLDGKRLGGLGPH
jgi:hypothetical protein